VDKNFFFYFLVSTCKIDILFIIEASYYTSSIYSALVSAIGDMAGILKISSSDIQVGVISYDNSVDENIKFNAYSSASSLDTAISSLTIPSASSSMNFREALRYAFNDYFKLSNGNRFDAYRYFVVFAKTYSSNDGDELGEVIRRNTKNQLFAIGNIF
jgi:hypothetical protein